MSSILSSPSSHKNLVTKLSSILFSYFSIKWDSDSEYFCFLASLPSPHSLPLIVPHFLLKPLGFKIRYRQKEKMGNFPLVNDLMLTSPRFQIYVFCICCNMIRCRKWNTGSVGEVTVFFQQHTIWKMKQLLFF